MTEWVTEWLTKRNPEMLSHLKIISGFVLIHNKYPWLYLWTMFCMFVWVSSGVYMSIVGSIYPSLSSFLCKWGDNYQLATHLGSWESPLAMSNYFLTHHSTIILLSILGSDFIRVNLKLVSYFLLYNFRIKHFFFWKLETFS